MSQRFATAVKSEGEPSCPLFTFLSSAQSCQNCPHRCTYTVASIVCQILLCFSYGDTLTPSKKYRVVKKKFQCSMSHTIPRIVNRYNAHIQSRSTKCLQLSGCVQVVFSLRPVTSGWGVGGLRGGTSSRAPSP